jgi:hypothetical protein
MACNTHKCRLDNSSLTQQVEYMSENKRAKSGAGVEGDTRLRVATSQALNSILFYT